ncbi:MAG: sensor diguanylate cyclase [Sphingomonas bacterium]|jgi:diguanylate cyclase (GGDEF)-like protein|nr:sensor domain-containing diguanylate cyclase [Sphingomonas bacterium]MDB5689554.1 sensor diguanylate cyclase [Sphingomonas bacterium]
MRNPRLEDDEGGRLAALARLEVLDTAPEQPFDKIVGLVRTVLSVPMAMVTLVDRDRQWFKARQGLDAPETERSISFCTHTIRQQEPLVVGDAREDPRFAGSPLVTGDPFIRAYAGAPLRTPDGYNVGALCAIDTQPRNFSGADLAILTSFATLVVDELELRQIAIRDQLTGALSRRGFIERCDQEIARFRRYDRPCSLVLLDVDHFKAVNDTHGHPAGDEVLRQIAELCTLTMRPTDPIGRIGGEEFALLLPETDPDAAAAAVERLRAAIEAHAFRLRGGPALRITASFGVAAIGTATDSAESWLAAADRPLYAAKESGRNRCCR